jgi:hypothetical protein
MNVDTTQDERYFTLLSNALRVCSRYKPKFGRGGDQGLTLEQFQQIYGADPFYNWIGINSPLMYAAHKAAGGMTSVYRQLGIGCERIFRAILQDTLGLLDSQVIWSYQVPDSRGKLRNLSLDGRIDTGHIADEKTRKKIQNWLEKAGEMLRIDQDNREHIKGMVFEVRQGIKARTQNDNMQTLRMQPMLTPVHISLSLLCYQHRWTTILPSDTNNLAGYSYPVL